MKRLLLWAVACAALLAQQCWGIDPLDVWTWRNPLPTGNVLSSVAYGNGLFVAVGNNGTIVASQNGTNWSQMNSGLAGNITGIAYGKGEFVAVSGPGPAHILTSRDGTNWSPQSFPITNLTSVVGFGAVIYGGGLFVAVGSVNDDPDPGGKIWTSSDGTNWVTWERYSYDYMTYRAVSYGNGMFVAMGSDQNGNGATFTSVSGISWTQSDAFPYYYTVNGLSYANGRFVAVGVSATNGYFGTITTSVDGTNWSRQIFTQGNYFVYVTYGNNLFVALGQSGTIFTSPDGITWSQNPTMPGTFTGLAAGNNQYVAVGEDSTHGFGKIIISSNANAWLTENSGPINNLNGLGYANGRFLTTGYWTNLISTNGSDWQGGDSVVEGTGHFAYGAGRYVAGTEYDNPGYNPTGGALYSSTNWETWTQVTNGIILDTTYGNGKFVALKLNPGYPSSYTSILTSSNGIDWATNSFVSTWPLSGIAFGGGEFVAVEANTSGAVFTSPDAVNWSQQPLVVTNGNVNKIVYGNGRFVAVGWLCYCSAWATICTSTNGISWQQIAVGLVPGLSDICYGGGQFVAVGVSGTILTSTDGLSWSSRNSGTAVTLRNVVYGSGHFVVVGDLGTILQSGDVTPHAPTIISPQSQTTQVGNNVVFTVTASGTAPLNYQWQFNGQKIAGQTTASLSLADVHFVDAGGYSVIVNNAYGSVSSSIAQLTVSAPLTLTQTSRIPTSTEVGSPTIPTDNNLKVFVSGSGFHSGVALNPTVMTVVLTHGWNSNPGDWATSMASSILASLPRPQPNIVAWDWSADAASPWYDLGLEAGKTPGQGYALAQALLQALGPSYSHPLHFIGHSLGALVNGTAAQYLEDNGYSGANMQITLFDEAEVAWGVNSTGFWQFVTSVPTVAATLSANFSTAEPYFDEPLPQQFAWADNYISAFGLLHPEAANVILTDGFPTTASDTTALYDELLAFHHYPMNWYDETIQNNGASIMGFRWSFEDGGWFNQAPAANSVYFQSDSSSQWNLEKIDFVTGEQQLDARFQKYLNALGGTALQTVPNTVEYYGGIAAQSLYAGFGQGWNMVFNLNTGAGSSAQIQNSGLRPLGGPVPNGTGSGNVAAYAWMPLNVPTNAVSMSFDFILQGNGSNDSFQVALDGTNVLSLETKLLQTNVAVNSGLIDVSEYAGEQVELFLGIIGGTSTNAALTVSDFQFYNLLPPSLQIQLTGTNVVLTWPLSATGYSLEFANQFTPMVSWTTVTNVPVIVNFQYTVTNRISNGSLFYRLATVTAPTLQAQVSGNNFVLSWPASAIGYYLETTSDLADRNSWTVLTDDPTIVNLQNTVTNSISGGARFYRLIK